MDCQNTFNKIVSYLMLYEVNSIFGVCKKWNSYMENDPLYWRYAYSNFLFICEPDIKGRAVTKNEFKEEYLKIYTEIWMKQLHKFILNKIYNQPCVNEYMKMHNTMFELVNEDGDSNNNVMRKILEMIGKRNDKRVINAVKAVCSYVLRCTHPRIRLETEEIDS